MPQFRNKKSIRFLVISSRVGLGIIFLTAGLSKIIEFPVVIGPVWLEEQAAEYGMDFFARFVAISEAIAGALLLSRFATLGAIILYPILLCILMFTISLNWQGTPVVNSLLLLLNTGLLLYDWPKLKFLFTDQVKEIDKIPVIRHQPALDAAALVGMAFIITGMLLINLSPFFEYLIYLGLLITVLLPVAAQWFHKKKQA